MTVDLGPTTPRVAASPIGRVACATTVFRVAGRLHGALVVKATFAIGEGPAMALVEPEAIAWANEVPYKPRADVVLRGHARAPEGLPAPVMGVRLVVASGRGVVLDKHLAVRGEPDPRGPWPLPFTAMELSNERGAPAAGRWANVIDPRRGEGPASFGPLASAPALLADYPADFAWARLQAAPEDQRVDFLGGAEWIAFEGMNEKRPRVEACLPGLVAKAKLYGPKIAAGRSIALHADTLSLDADRMRASLAFRGSLGPLEEGELEVLHVFAGLEGKDAALVFPASYLPPIVEGPPSRRRAARRKTLSVTGDMPAFSTGVAAPATPFQATPPVVAKRVAKPTVALSLEALAQAGAAPATPFEAARRAPPSPSSPPPPLAPPTALPFAAAPRALPPAPSEPPAPPSLLVARAPGPELSLGAFYLLAREKLRATPARALRSR